MEPMAPMPSRHAEGAPRFDGCPHLLNRYLEEVEQLCADRGIVKEDTVIGWMVYYTSPDEEEFFRTIRCDHGNTVKAFVSALRKEYLGAKEDERSSM